MSVREAAVMATLASASHQTPAPPLQLPLHRPPSAAASSDPVSSSQPPPSPVVKANSVRVLSVIERFALYFKGGIRCETAEFFHLCFSLARGIDIALTNNHIPPVAESLPSIIKQVYLRRNDTALQSAITVLMISIKNACKNGWFNVTDADELFSMANELFNSFCMEISITSEAGDTLDTISRIIPRFYPQLKLGRIVVSFEAKPGYDVLMADFHIMNNIPSEEMILLFVVQTDNLETSSCIINPPQVSFLVNGRGVEKRTNVSPDSGPQFPSDIRKMLKYGANIIQAAGYFKGNYLIAIAFANKISFCSTPMLKDYIQPIVAATTSDSEIIEGPSRIVLNCPISLKRIKTPVKGYLCKHHQCFDYHNFIEMNSRKPSWRCPCCNQPVCFIDLHVDQNMVKILGAVGEDVNDVVIFADGTWKVVAEHNGTTDQLHNGVPSEQQDDNMECQQDSVDLTMEEDGNNDAINIGTFETEDRKPVPEIQGFPHSLYSSEPPLDNRMTMATQASTYQIGGESWSRFLPSPATIPRLSDGCAVGTLASMLPAALLNPVVTDTVSPALARDHSSGLETPQPTFPVMHVSQARQPTESMQLQHSWFGGPIVSAETERPPIPRHVTRNPVAIQALPVQTQTPSLSQRIQTDVLTPVSVLPNGSSSFSYQTTHLDERNTVNGGIELPEVPRTTDMAVTQGQIRNPSAQQVVGLAAASSRVYHHQQQRGGGAYRNSMQPPPDIHSPMNQLLMNQQSQQNSTSPASRLRQKLQPAQIAAMRATQMQVQAEAARMAAASNPGQRAANSPRFSTTSSSSGFRVGSQRTEFAGDGSDGLVGSDLPYDQNWRPTGRMRGSLTGNAYSAALNKYSLPPTPQPQARPPPPPGFVNVVPPNSGMPSVLNSGSASANLPGL